MLLSFIVMSFYYGLTCFGGFSQIAYLPEMQKAYLSFLDELEIFDALGKKFAWQEEKNIAAAVDTDRFCSDIVFNYVSKKPATIVDLIKPGRPEEIWLKVLNRAKRITLKQAIMPMFPEFYKILYGGRDYAETKCLYCGLNQVPHRLEWYHQSMDVLLSPLRRRILYSRFGILFQKIIARMLYGLVFVFSKMGIIRKNTDSQQIKIPRAKVLWDEAVAQGISIQEMRFFKWPIDVYQAQLNGSKIIFNGLPRPKNYYNEALDWVDDKFYLKKALAAKKLPVPAGASFMTWQGALKAFRNLQKPVIVKPRIGSRGRHTTTYIYNEEQFKQAYDIAKKLCAWVIVEEHLTGPVWRGTVVSGKCVGVLGGDPPKVTGDGQSNIERLIVLANASKHVNVEEIVSDEKMEDFLARRNLSLKSVLPRGQQIYLNEKIGTAYGGSSFEVFEQAHPEIKKMFEDAAAVIGDPVLGFDFICEDITKSWREQSCGIIECNGLPFINLHHHPLHGQPRNVAKYVWEYMKQSS
jgi:D-alanine-D-alanine ligase-like ATP-grasp enzyme